MVERLSQPKLGKAISGITDGSADGWGDDYGDEGEWNEGEDFSIPDQI